MLYLYPQSEGDTVRILKTIVAGFAAGRKPVWVDSATFVGEAKRPAMMYRVVAGLVDVAKPTTRVVAPMTPLEARRVALWLNRAADEADMLNEHLIEAHDPRVSDPDE